MFWLAAGFFLLLFALDKWRRERLLRKLERDRMLAEIQRAELQDAATERALGRKLEWWERTFPK
jgi:hypothetical protein